MGHQFNYYLTSTDLRDAIDRTRRCGDCVLLHYRSLEPKPRILSDADFREAGTLYFSFWLVRTEDLLSIRMREVPSQHYWSIDDKSAVIELGACGLRGNYMRRSRAFYEDAYYNADGRAVSKPQPFLDWAKCIFAAMKRTLKYDRVCYAYIGRNTLAWVKNGGQLVEAWKKIDSDR